MDSYLVNYQSTDKLIAEQIKIVFALKKGNLIGENVDYNASREMENRVFNLRYGKAK